jgi:lysozyme
MKMTDEGLALIREFEGFRETAYRDATGIWTIGFGHTSAAGKPEVTPDMTVTRARGEVILRNDVAMFVDGVTELLRVPLSDAQFSALVSFAYNVGITNFARSSVLACVNARDFDNVSRRLGLWVKAGNRTLPGLIRRRAAEAALFASGETANDRLPDLPLGKAPLQSRTILAAILAMLAGITQRSVHGISWLEVLFLVVIITSCIIIIHQRIQKSRQEGI